VYFRISVVSARGANDDQSCRPSAAMHHFQFD